MAFNDLLPPITLNRGEAAVLIRAINVLARKIRVDTARSTFVPAPGKTHSGPAQLATLDAIKTKLVDRLDATPETNSASAQPHAGPTDQRGNTTLET